MPPRSSRAASQVVAGGGPVEAEVVSLGTIVSVDSVVAVFAAVAVEVAGAIAAEASKSINKVKVTP